MTYLINCNLDAILAIFDVEANYFVVRAYQYTSMLSIMLLDTWTIPCVVLLSILFLKVKFHWSQYLAILICLIGIAALIVADTVTNGKEYMNQCKLDLILDIPLQN